MTPFKIKSTAPHGDSIAKTKNKERTIVDPFMSLKPLDDLTGLGMLGFFQLERFVD